MFGFAFVVILIRSNWRRTRLCVKTKKSRFPIAIKAGSSRKGVHKRLQGIYADSVACNTCDHKPPTLWKDLHGLVPRQDGENAAIVYQDARSRAEFIGHQIITTLRCKRSSSRYQPLSLRDCMAILSSKVPQISDDERDEFLFIWESIRFGGSTVSQTDFATLNRTYQAIMTALETVS